jgi:uncharacterized protein YndB with AHSA1/START domain
MQKLTHTTTIHASPEAVWHALLDDASYRDWTAEFAEGSHAVTDWKEGSKALFLGPGGDGMLSRIAVHRPNEFLSIEHLGMVKDGVEDTDSALSQAWAGSHENYTLTDAPGGGVLLTIDLDSTDDCQAYFETTWPKALDRLKGIAEGTRKLSA